MYRQILLTLSEAYDNKIGSRPNVANRVAYCECIRSLNEVLMWTLACNAAAMLIEARSPLVGAR